MENGIMLESKDRMVEVCKKADWFVQNINDDD
jgi:hypothetical protein